MGVFDGVCHVIELRDELAAGNEAPVHPIEVAEDGDVQSGAFDGWSQRQHGHDSSAGEIRAGTVVRGRWKSRG